MNSSTTIQIYSQSIGKVGEVLVFGAVPDGFYVSDGRLADLFLYKISKLSAFNHLELGYEGLLQDDFGAVFFLIVLALSSGLFIFIIIFPILMKSILWSHLQEPVEISPYKTLSLRIECGIEIIGQVVDRFTGISE